MNRWWRWKRAGLSAVIVAHLAAVILWNLPKCALRERCAGWTQYYLMPTGQWQGWDMFAPDPVRDTVALEAVVRDRHGMLRRYEFPRNADKGVWDALKGFRHSKFLGLMSVPEAVAYREFAARAVLRDLAVTPASYPADVELYYDLTRTPPPGAGPADPLARPEHVVLQVYRFPTYEEAQP